MTVTPTPVAARTAASGALRGIGGGVRSEWGLLGLLLFLLAAGCTPVSLPESDTFGFDAPELQRFSVEADGHPLTVWARIPQAPEATVLLLHGRTWSSLPDFDLEVEGESLSLMQALAREGIATYALDARGYGATPRDDSGWLDPDRMALDVVRVLEWLGDRTGAPPAVMGWSYGSTTAHLAAQRRPDLVAGVALYGYWKDPDADLPAAESPDRPPALPTTEAAARSDFIAPNAISERAIEAFVMAALAADPVRVDIRRADAFNALAPDSLDVPTLVLQGALDPIAPSAAQARLFTRLGTDHKSWVVLAGCDHAAHLEHCMPRFVRTLSGFIHEVAGR